MSVVAGGSFESRRYEWAKIGENLALRGRSVDFSMFFPEENLSQML